MLNAPVFHQRPGPPSSPRASSTPRLATAADDAQVACERLSGTIWARGPIPSVYRGGLAFGRWLAGVGVSADALTVSSLVLAAVAGIVAGVGALPLAALFVLASGACDALDGIVARASGRTSASGALLDSTVDRLSDALPLIGLTVFFADEPHFVWMPALAMVGAFTVSYIRARAGSLGAELPPLFMRRPERVLLLAVGLALGDLSLPGVPVAAPLLLVTTAVLGLLSFAGAWLALHSARTLLASPPVTESPERRSRR